MQRPQAAATCRWPRACRRACCPRPRNRQFPDRRKTAHSNAVHAGIPKGSGLIKFDPTHLELQPRPLDLAVQGRQGTPPAGRGSLRRKPMRRLTRDDVTKAVGRADGLTVAEIIGTGATIDELAEAQAWIANDEPLMNAVRPLPRGRVGELVEILNELAADEDDREPNADAVIKET